MARDPTPAEIFDRAVEEGERRLDQPLLELVSTSFIAGFTVVFGIVALGIVEAHLRPQFAGLARPAGALAFGLGVVFLVVGRTELFNENFTDPTAAAVDRGGLGTAPALLRLWSVTLLFNLIGGALMVWIFSIEGTLPAGTGTVLAEFATESAHRAVPGSFARGVAGGALVSLLSFLLAAAEATGSRMALAYAVGFLLALGPFEHVVVTVLHAYVGLLYGAAVTPGALLQLFAVVTAGNLVGGLGLVTFTHVTQAWGARESSA